MNMKWFFAGLLLPLLINAQSERTLLTFPGPKVRLNTEPMFPPPPQIVWQTGSGRDTVVRNDLFPIRVCLVNFSSRSDSIKFFVNGQLQGERGYGTGKDKNLCANASLFTRDQELRDGENRLRMEVITASGRAAKEVMVKYFALEKRLALVIGNSAYPGSRRLQNPVNDANAIAEVLQAADFEVIKLTDVSRNNLETEINKFARRLTTDEFKAGLFYYAGHGVQINGESYLVPVDAFPNTDTLDEDRFTANCIAANFLMDKLQKSAATSKIIILDACRDDPFRKSGTRGIGGAGAGLGKIQAPAGSIVAYATGTNEVADDGDGKNGRYTEGLLKAIRTPNLSLSEVFDQTRQYVQSRSRRQTPWELSSMTNITKFYFIRQ